MFRKDDEFDEVKNYQKQKKRKPINNDFQDDSRFKGRNDYNFNEVHSEHMDKAGQKRTDRPYKKANDPSRIPRTEPRQTNKRKNNGWVGKLVLLVVCVNISRAFLPGIVGSIGDAVNNDNLFKSNEYQQYVKKDIEAIDAKEFVKRYETAKKNRITYNSSFVHSGGNFSEDYTIERNKITYENFAKGNKSYICTVEDYVMIDNYINCGEYTVAQVKQPADYISKGISPNFFGTKHNDLYYINGYYYTDEFCQDVVRWVKNI